MAQGYYFSEPLPAKPQRGRWWRTLPGRSVPGSHPTL